MPARNLSEARASIEAFEKRKSQWPPARHARATASPPAPPIKTPPIKKPPIKKNPVKPPPPKRSSPKKWVLHLNVTKTLVNNRKVGGLSPLLGHFRLDAKDLPLDVTWKCGEETWVRKVRKERRDPRCGQVSSTGWSPIVKALQLQVGDKLQLLPSPGPREVLLSRRRGSRLVQAPPPKPWEQRPWALEKVVNRWPSARLRILLHPLFHVVGVSIGMEGVPAK